MQPVYQAVLRSWSIPPATTFAIVVTAVVYLRGWWLLRRAGSPSVPVWRAVAFFSGLLSLWVALASPMDVFNSFVLTAHMLQHMLLMMAAPPLILLGSPLIPIIRGLPVFAAREFAGPLLNWPLAQRVGITITHPVFTLLLMGAVMFAWHTPTLYEMALRSANWHQIEHACFFLTSILFWWPVVQPWPSRAHWPRWAMVPYLLIADLQNTILSAILAFSDRVIYPSYARAPRLFDFSALQDQVAAGAMMWVLGSMAFLIPAILIAVQCLSKKRPVAGSPGRLDIPALDALLSFPERISLLSRSAWNSKRLEAASFLAFFVIAGVGFATLLSTGSDGDNQALRHSGASGPFQVSVFGPAGDIETGPTDFGVLLQDRNTGETLLDATVELKAVPAKNPDAETTPVRATQEQSDDKLLQAAEVSLPTAGEWALEISVHRNGQSEAFTVPISVATREPEIAFPWSYLYLVIFASILLAAYLRRRRLQVRERVEEPALR